MSALSSPAPRLLPLALTFAVLLGGCGPGCSPPAVCAGVDCSGHGTCDDVEGEARCVCNAGYVPADLACVDERAPKWEASLTHVVENPGMSNFQVFSLTFSENTLLELLPFPTVSPLAFTATERIEQEVRGLPLESCAVLRLRENPRVDCLNAGTLSLTAPWPGFDFPALEYSLPTDNYPAQVVFGASLGTYAVGAPMELRAQGGPEIAAFTQAATSPPELLLQSPVHDRAVTRPTIPLDQPLLVRWSGQGSASRASIVLAGEWATKGASGTIGCNVANDGEFSIPASVLTGLSLGQVASVSVAVSETVPLSVPELPGGYLRVGSRAQLLVHYDPDAVPVRERPTYTMKAGYVGDACSADSQCGGGICARSSLYFMGGYCTVASCVDDQDCPADARCFDDTFGYSPYPSYCARTCQTGSNCGRSEPVYGCSPQVGWSACVPTPG